MDKISINDLERFRNQHFRINGATLIISGQFEELPVRSEILRLFGKWDGSKAGPAPPLLPSLPDRTTPTYFLSEDEKSEQISVSITFPTLRGFKRNRPARRVVRHILSQRMSSLRTKLASTYGVNVSHVSHEGPGYYRIYGDIDPERAGPTLKAINDELDRLRNGDDLAEDFVRARRAVLRAVLADSVSSTSVADELELIATYGLSQDYYQQQAEAIANLSLADVKEVIGRSLQLKDAVYFASGPAAKLKEMYQAIGAKDPQSL